MRVDTHLYETCVCLAGAIGRDGNEPEGDSLEGNRPLDGTYKASISHSLPISIEETGWNLQGHSLTPELIAAMVIAIYGGWNASFLVPFLIPGTPGGGSSSPKKPQHRRTTGQTCIQSST